MSLDVYLEEEEVTHQENICGECGNMRKVSFNKTLFHGNVTHNLTAMAEDARLYDAVWRPDENNIKYASQLISILNKGLIFLHKNRTKLERLNPENGWGSYESFLIFISDYLEACEKYPKSIVTVWR